MKVRLLDSWDFDLKISPKKESLKMPGLLPKSFYFEDLFPQGFFTYSVRALLYILIKGRKNHKATWSYSKYFSSLLVRWS